MKAIELKKLLIHRIAEINDVSFLNAIKTILDTKSQSQTLILNEEQQDEISTSRIEIGQKFFVEQAALDNEFKKWANAK